MKTIVLSVLSIGLLLAPGNCWVGHALDFDTFQCGSLPQNDFTKLPPIKVFLRGHLCIRFTDCNTPARVTSVAGDTHHNQAFYVLEFGPNDPSSGKVLYSRWGPLKDDLWLWVSEPMLEGIHRLGKKQVDRTKTTVEPNSFGWAVDLESSELHKSGLTWEPEGLTPSLYITNGVFYTQHIAADPLLDKIKPDGNGDPFGYVADQIAVWIDFPGNIGMKHGFATLGFSHDDTPFLTFDPNIRYEIHMESVPLNPDAMTRSDFRDYYRVIHDDVGQFDFRVHSFKVNPNIPCMSGVFGGPPY